MSKKLIAFILFLVLHFFYYTGFAQQLSPSIVWQKCLGGSGGDSANSIVKTLDNGFLVVGSSNSSDGDVVGHHGTNATTDGWVVKLSANGTIDWQLSVGGTDDDAFKSVIRTADGDFVCLGITNSNDGDVSGNHGNGDLWVVKISRTGTILWSKTYGGSSYEIAGNIRQNSDGSFYLIGSSKSNDGDVSGHHGTSSFYDIWIAKLNSAGTIQWQQSYGGSLDDWGYDITESADANFVIGTSINSDDGDFGPGTGNVPRGYLIKIDASTKTMLGKSLRPLSKPIQIVPYGNEFYVNFDVLGCSPTVNNHAAASAIYDDNTDTILSTSHSLAFFSDCIASAPVNGYLTADASSLAPINQVDNIFVCSTDDVWLLNGLHGNWDGFISGIKTDIGQSWYKIIGGTGYDELESVAIINENEFVVAGFTNSLNGDVSGNHGGADAWVVKLGQVNTIKGTVFMDYNANGNKDSNEPFVNNIVVQSQKQDATFGSPTKNGLFSNAVDTGAYMTTLASPVPYYNQVPASVSSNFTSYNNKDSVSFALQPIASKRDYSVNVFPQNRARPGFDITLTIMFQNKGTDTLHNKTVTLIKDNRLSLVQPYYLPDIPTVSGDTLTWNVATLLPRDSAGIQVALHIAAPPTVSFGDTLLLIAVIDSTGDLNTVNNVSVLNCPVTGSFDPNNKEEINAGTIVPDDVVKGKDLLYTIRFQNTGTDTAFNITVRDTLSNKLIASTIEMLGSSHPYQLTIKDSAELIWTFANILLPDSNVNEPKSHGYISYRIKPKNNLVIGDSIRNIAGIYFDYNLPVETNNALTVVKVSAQPGPARPVVSGIDAIYCKAPGTHKAKILNLPTAASSTAASVTLDSVQALTIAADSSFSFVTDTLSTGMHRIITTFTNAVGSKTTISGFSVPAMSTPDVNISANITTIVNLIDPVILTATNVLGGGSDPTFYFATDRNFYDLLQTGSVNILSISPQTLNEGDNWIYVMMKTSDSCYSALTNVDSIKLTRIINSGNGNTGIVDPDYPNQFISAYPNPYHEQCIIAGFNPSKTYNLTVYNMQGKKVLDMDVSNQNTITIEPGFINSGYVLRVYDKTKNRFLGALKLLNL